MIKGIIGLPPVVVLLLGGVLFATQVEAQSDPDPIVSQTPSVEGSGGVAADMGAAAALVTEASPVTFRTFTGQVDHAAAGCGLRNFDSCTLRLRGIPGGSTVVRAFLYWAMICVDTTCPSTVDIEFEGRTITTRLFCSSGQPCWTGTTLGAYLANVTGLMPATTSAAVPNKVINGDYRINGIPSHPAERDGRDPWLPGTTNLPKAEGATLLVVYSNPSLTTSGRVYVHHGCDLFSGTLTVSNALGIAAPSPIVSAKFTRFGADGQVGPPSTSATPVDSDEKSFFGGPGVCTGALPQIAGDGSLLDRDSDWNGHDGGPLNQLWDTRTTTVTGKLGAGAANYCVRYVSLGDCINAIGYVLTVR